MIRRSFLKSVLAAIGALIAPIGGVDVQQSTTGKISEVVSVMQDMAYPQHRYFFDYIYALFVWKVYSDWCAATKKSRFASEYNLKDLPEGFDTWVNALELPHMIQLYEAVKSEEQRLVPGTHLY